MNYGLYLSASGVLTNMYRQDVLSNNLANVQTAGFKADLAMLRQRDPEAITSGAGMDVRKDLLDRLGGGAWAGPQRVSLEVGSITTTGGPLDAALPEANSFFQVGVTDPKTGQTAVRLTRDGRFTVGKNGRLVTVADGSPVLDDHDQPITLDADAPVKIAGDGRMLQNDQEVAQLGVASVSDTSRLVKDGRNRLRLAGPDSLRQMIDAPSVTPGAIESSAVDPIRTMVDLMNTTRAINDNANLIKNHELLMDRAVNTLGRVA